MAGTEVGERPVARRRKFGGRALTWFLALLTLVFAAAAGLRIVMSAILERDGFGYATVALALTPYVAGAGLVLALLAALFRRWSITIIAALITGALGFLMLPRVTADDQPVVDGPELRVLAVNLYYGEADPEAVVDAIRTHSADVVALSELTPGIASALEDAGLSDMLPHQHFIPGPRAQGTGIASRYPLIGLGLVENTTFQHPSARIDVRGTSVEFVATHTVPPINNFQDWIADLRALPPGNQRGRIRMLAGDFNATLDHAEFRRLLDRGYVDAADALGEGLATTWPHLRWAPPVGLDHVLVDPRTRVHVYETVEIAGSDHSGVLTTVRLPAANS